MHVSIGLTSKTNKEFVLIAEPVTEIAGAPDLFINKYSTINLTCLVKYAPEPPSTIVWSHDHEVSTRNVFLLCPPKAEDTEGFSSFRALTENSYSRDKQLTSLFVTLKRGRRNTCTLYTRFIVILRYRLSLQSIAFLRAPLFTKPANKLAIVPGQRCVEGQRVNKDDSNVNYSWLR